MGNEILKIFDCSHICHDCTRFVCNSMTFHSDCCDYVNIDCKTNEIDISDNDSEIQVEICTYHKKIKFIL